MPLFQPYNVFPPGIDPHSEASHLKHLLNIESKSREQCKIARKWFRANIVDDRGSQGLNIELEDSGKWVGR